jgi:hypothetical protein
MLAFKVAIEAKRARYAMEGVDRNFLFRGLRNGEKCKVVPETR